MSTENINRCPFKETMFPDLDLTKPVKIEELKTMMTNGSCFGLEWDMREQACSECADNEVCGIIYADAQRTKVKEMDNINKYLDVSRLDQVDEDIIKLWLGIQPRKVVDLINKVMEDGKTTDQYAVIEWVKRLIKNDPDLYTKDGIVCTR